MNNNNEWLFYYYFWSNYANCIFIFHKADVQTVILMCLTGIKPDWFKGYDAKCKYFHFHFFAILFKNTYLQNVC